MAVKASLRGSPRMYFRSGILQFLLCKKKKINKTSSRTVKEIDISHIRRKVNNKSVVKIDDACARLF